MTFLSVFVTLCNHWINPNRQLTSTYILTSLITQENVSAEMRDGSVLKADIYRPDDGGQHPVLLLRTPYWKLNPRYINSARKLAEQGYTVICQDMRGRYDSEGDFKWQRHATAGRTLT